MGQHFQYSASRSRNFSLLGSSNPEKESNRCLGIKRKVHEGGYSHSFLFVLVEFQSCQLDKVHEGSEVVKDGVMAVANNQVIVPATIATLKDVAWGLSR